MKIGVYAIRDAKTEAFSQPMFFITRGIALRSFSEECENTSSSLAKHPEDFAMFHLGEYDDAEGSLTSLPQPVQIAKALDFVKVLSA